jgi:TRAP-type mannitol/chloroaromatic compound transport system permease small subunit
MKYKKLAYLIPIILIVLFPYYFKAVFDSYSWLSDSKDTKGLVSFGTIIVIGWASGFLIFLASND